MKQAVLALAVFGVLANSPALAESDNLAGVETPPMARVIHGGSAAQDTGSDNFPAAGNILRPTVSNLARSEAGSDSVPDFAGAALTYGAPNTALAGAAGSPGGG